MNYLVVLYNISTDLVAKLLVPASWGVDRGLIPGRVIPKTLQMYSMLLCLTLNIQSKIEGKCSPEQGVPTPTSSSEWERSLRVTLDISHKLILLHTTLPIDTRDWSLLQNQEEVVLPHTRSIYIIPIVCDNMVCPITEEQRKRT